MNKNNLIIQIGKYASFHVSITLPQRTMTTGMGALAQQTVVQQHVNPMAQSLQARQQAAMTQGLMQQRAVRSVLWLVRTVFDCFKPI